MGLPHIIGIVCLISVWMLNVFGIRPTVNINKALGVLSVALISLLIIGPFITGEFDAGRLTWGLGADGQAWGGVRLALVFLFIFGWTAYGTEICATFAPEYRDAKRDTSMALRTAAMFTLLVATLLPLGLSGTVGDAAIAKDPGAIYARAFDAIVGPASGLVTLLVCASIYLVTNSATADAGRALYGIAKDDMTVKQLNHLNARGVPARAMFCDLVINIALLLFVGNTLSIIFAANVGYMTAVFFAVTGFLLLRRDRPAWPRPIRLGRAWAPVAAILGVYNLVLVVVGGLNPGDAGYGGTEEQLIGVGILLSSLVLFLYRRVVQDRGPLRLREETPRAPQATAEPPATEIVGVPVA